MPPKNRTTLPQRDDVALATDQPGIEQIAIDAIKTDGGTQMRAELNVETVGDYATIMHDAGGWGPFPPVTLFYDGSAYWLADGFHRIAAAKNLLFAVATTWTNHLTVPAKIIPGDRRAAILHAAAANANHGLRRTNADKRRSVETLLRDEEWRAWSDAEIARRCLVDPKTVGNIRRELSSTMEIPESDQRKTADGRTMNTANIGEFISPYRLRDDIQAWIEERYTLRTEYLTCLNHLITLKQESQLWPELVKHLPSAAKSRDILTALDLVKERITDAIAADTITTHQLPSGTWYARNHRKYNVDATDSFATEAEAHTAAAAKNWLPGRHFDLAHIDSIIHDLTAREYIGVTRYDNVIKGAEGWLLNEIHIGLEAAAAAEPDQLELQRRLDLVRKRISDLEATIALVRPEPLIVYTGSPSPPSLPQYSPSGQLLPGLTTQVYVKSRRENLFHLRDLYNEVLATLEDYEKLTGIFGHASTTRKAIRPMLEMVERNLGLVPAEQESKDAVHS